MHKQPYSPRNWFWVIGDDKTQAWSSAAGAFVREWPEDRQTNIVNVEELNEVMRALDMVLPQPTRADYAATVQRHIDTVAQAKGYANGLAAASYVSSSIQEWAAESVAFLAWRDAVWMFAHAQLAAVQAGQRIAPTPDVLVSELPLIEWP